MNPVCRIGDIGTGYCICHTTPIIGTIILGSPNVLCGGQPSARLGDMVIGSCGHVTNLIIGNPTVLVNNQPKSRIGDQFLSGCIIGTISTGLSTVLA